MARRILHPGVAGISAAIVLAALSVPAIAGAQITFQNDGLVSGSDGIVSCGFVATEKFGAIFVPEAGDYPFTIDSVQFMLLPYDGDCVEVTPGDAIPVTVEIWNDAAAVEAPDGAPVCTGVWAVASSTTVMNDLPIGDSTTLRIESGVIRVAVTLSSDEIKPVRDADGITAERNLIYDIGGTWHWSEDYAVVGDWVLRVTATHVPAPPEEDEAETTPESADPEPDADTDAGEDADALDSPADTWGDGEDLDVDEDTGDNRLGGGGCSCSVAS